MSAFVDTNWLEALYIEPDQENRESVARAAIAERRSRKERFLATSPIVLLEARNVFSRVTGQSEPAEWLNLEEDFNGKIFVDPMNWDLLRRETFQIFERFSHKVTIGAFDAALVASAQLAGAREFLSFDEELQAVATALGMKVYPPLTARGRAFLAKLRAD